MSRFYQYIQEIDQDHMPRVFIHTRPVVVSITWWSKRMFLTKLAYSLRLLLLWESNATQVRLLWNRIKFGSSWRQFPHSIASVSPQTLHNKVLFLLISCWKWPASCESFQLGWWPWHSLSSVKWYCTHSWQQRCPSNFLCELRQYNNNKSRKALQDVDFSPFYNIK